MADFRIAADFASQLESTRDFVATEVEPLDLGGFCEIWSEIAGQVDPNRATPVEHYRAVRGIGSTRAMTYYPDLCKFRLAVLRKGMYHRSLRDPGREPQHDIGRRALANLDRALAIVGDESG